MMVVIFVKFEFFSYRINLDSSLNIHLMNVYKFSTSLLTCSVGLVKEASVPFGRGRSGMILGSGGIGMVLESEEGARRRFQLAVSNGLISQQDSLSKKILPFK